MFFDKVGGRIEKVVQLPWPLHREGELVTGMLTVAMAYYVI